MICRIVFEHRRQPLVSRPVYYRRLVRHGAIGLGMIGGALGIGVLGYHYAEGLGWLDALLNGSMILSGMGPVQELKTDAGKGRRKAQTLPLRNPRARRAVWRIGCHGALPPCAVVHRHAPAERGGYNGNRRASPLATALCAVAWSLAFD